MGALRYLSAGKTMHLCFLIQRTSEHVVCMFRPSVCSVMGSGNMWNGHLRFMVSLERCEVWYFLTIVPCFFRIICRRDRAEELRTMRMIVDKYPERNARAVKERYEAALAAKREDSSKTE